jgi:predicted transposase/invertase (TIGR01784 family)
MIKKLRSYHDTFFQSMMEKIEVAKSFFRAHTSKELLQAIDWDTLKIADAVRRSPNRKPSYTDITYHALTKSGGNVYLHVEQERGFDNGMIGRILEYNAALYSKHRNQGYDKLPLIINFVVYNGIKKDYPHFEDVCEYFEEPELARLIINKSFHLVNLIKQDDEDFVAHESSGVMEVLLKRASRANFIEWMKEHKELMRKLPAGPYLNIGVDYALGVSKGKAEDIIDSFILVYPELKDVIMTAATQLRREGEKIGMQQGIMEVAKNMILKLHLDIDTVQKATELTKEELQEIIKEATKK